MADAKDTRTIAAAAAVIIAVISRRRRRRKLRWYNRRWWTRPWIQRRDEGRELHSLLNNELRLEDSESYKNFLRMDEAQFTKLLNLVEPRIIKMNTNMRESISASRRLVLTLRFLATGESYKSLMYSFRISASAISTIIPETCKAIYESLKDEYLKMPSTENEWLEISKQYEEIWNFPNCLGALDGKHVEFRPPRCIGSYYFNYKGGNSIVLLALVDAGYKFLYVDVGCNGRISDGGVLRNSTLHTIMDKNLANFPLSKQLPGSTVKVPYVIVADDAFPLQENIMKPYKGNLTQQQKIFNYRLSRARRTSENAFGILCNRFRILLKKIELPVETVEIITLSACALHNFLLTTGNKRYVGHLEEREDTEQCVVVPGGWRKENLVGLQRVGRQRSAEDARKIRDTYQEYFNTTGFVPWQWESIKNCNY
ncbi:uncharacterized protein [Anabrus simplex]|uniref:uncharacterized protein n=1 Tax=Anabrus simplex TaxID=316456 RepID=UPI0035A3A386